MPVASHGAPRVAVVGCGAWGQNLVRNFHTLGALAGICDPAEAVAARLQGEFETKALSFERILEDDSIQAIAIASPAAEHFRLAKDALTAGKDVFVEKPLALHVREGGELCALAERGKRILMVGHLLRYHPAYLRLKETARQGTLGAMQYLYSTRLSFGKFRSEENILWSFAPHDISMILDLVGDEPETVSAVGRTYLHEKIADTTTTHLRFTGGQAAHIFVSWLHPFKEQKLVVVGTEGMIVFDDSQPWSSKVSLYPHRVGWGDGVPFPIKAEVENLKVEEEEPLQVECAHFLSCISTRSTPWTDGKEGLRVLNVLSRAEQSMAETSFIEG